MAYELSRGFVTWLAVADTGTVSDTINIDSNLVFGTSGETFFTRFTAPVGQSASTLTWYLYVATPSGVTGAPTFQMQIRNAYPGSGDVDLPEAGGANLASSPSTLTLGAGDIGTWVSMTATVSLTAGNGYWLIAENTHGTPASNHAAFRYRGALDALNQQPANSAHFSCGYNITGFLNDTGQAITAAGSTGSAVVEFSDGTIMGNPYVVSDGAHANNTNARGNRLTTSGNAAVSGMFRPAASPSLSAATIYTTGGTQVVTAAGDAFSEGGTGGMYRFAPTTLAGGVEYYHVVEYSGARPDGTIYSMGEAEGDVPTSVKNCRPWSIAYVDGTVSGGVLTTTTVDTSKVLGVIGTLVDDFPAGGGIRMAGRGGLASGR